jgi:phosphate butyryltransferase
MIMKLDDILKAASGRMKKTLAVAAAQDTDVLKAVSEAVKLGLINAILIGNDSEIINICTKNQIDRDNIEIISTTSSEMAAKKAAELVNSGRADFVMKGMLSTAELLRAVLSLEKDSGTSKLLSHVMLYEIQSYHKLLILTDGGMVPNPDLKDKVQIIKNAVTLAKALGIEAPKVAPLCAVEVVNPSMQATIDAAALTAMNHRGQITGCVIDGPLALDNAVSCEAAKHKGIISQVAGDADILLVPNIESGNLLGKSLTYFAGAKNAGVVMGGRCPVVLVSRADTAKSKLYSIALGALI